MSRPPIDIHRSFRNRAKYRLSRSSRVQVRECTEAEDEVDAQQETRIVVSVGGIIIERIEPPDKVRFLKHRPVVVEPFEIDVDDLLRELAIAGEVNCKRLRAELDRGVGEVTTVETAEDPVVFVPGCIRVGGLASCG